MHKLEVLHKNKVQKVNFYLDTFYLNTNSSKVLRKWDWLVLIQFSYLMGELTLMTG